MQGIHALEIGVVVAWFVVCASVYIIYSKTADISLNILRQALEELADVPFSFGIN